MSVDLIRQFHQFAGEGRFEQALALFAPEAAIVFHGPQTNPLAGRHVGPVGIARFFGLIGDLFEIKEFEATEFIDAGATVVVIGREKSIVKSTGREFNVPWIQVWRTHEGRITALTDFFDTGSMAAAFEPSV